MKFNKKGFTLIELLAVILIIGIVSATAIISFNSVRKKMRTNYYASQENLVKLAANNYVEDNKSMFPKEVGKSKKILLSELIKKEYLSDVLDYRKNKCNYDNSYVVVYKYSKTKYRYNVYLDCPDYNVKEDNNGKVSDIVIVMKQSNNYKDPTASVTIKNLENGIASYSYVIYKNNKEIRNSGNIKLDDYPKSYSFDVKFDNLSDGIYKLKVIAIDKDGKETVKMSNDSLIIDTTGPVCGKNNGSDKWTNKNRNIELYYKDDVDGVEKKITKTFDKTTKIGIITISDSRGNSTDCKVNVYVDKDKPSCQTFVKNGDNYSLTTDNMSWIKGSREIRVSCSDMDSGCTEESNKLLTYNKSKKSDKYVVKDNAGNETECSFDVKVDNTAPKCVVDSKGITIGQRSDKNWGDVDSNDNDIYKHSVWTKNAVSLRAKCDDGDGSGCDLNRSETKSFSSSTPVELNYDSSSYKIYDAVGNEATCTNVYAKVDYVAPSVSIKLQEYSTLTSWVDYDGSWTNSNVYAMTSVSDKGSGFSSGFYKVDLDNGSSKSTSYPESLEVKDDGISSVYYVATDKAGNSSGYVYAGKNVSIDKTAPSCGDLLYTEANKRYRSDGSNYRDVNDNQLLPWTNVKKNLELGCLDNNGASLNSACSVGIIDNDYDISSNNSITNTNVEIKDNAGNKTTCKIPVKIDKVAPSCGSLTYDKNEYIKINGNYRLGGKEDGSLLPWTNTDKTINFECKDNESGCKNNLYTDTFTNNIKSDAITIEDKAGNVTKCDIPVKIDKVAPSCGDIKHGSTLISKESDLSWTNSDSRTMEVKCNDNDSGSGCLESSYSKKFDVADNSKKEGGTITISDKAGNETKCDVPVKIDKIAPSCGDIKHGSDIIDKNGSNLSWTNSEDGRTMKVLCSDSNSGCLESSYSEIFKAKTGEFIKNGSITIKDKAGNKTTCTVPVKIDREPPEITPVSQVSAIGKEGSTSYNICYGDAVTGKQLNYYKGITSTDKGSGIKSRIVYWAAAADRTNNKEKFSADTKDPEKFRYFNRNLKYDYANLESLPDYLCTKANNDSLAFNYCIVVRDAVGNCTARASKTTTHLGNFDPDYCTCDNVK